ncbi:MAG: ABC transporter permease [Gammaproteobacteria bacterium]|nr:ABC transporter permease [Gammaproteobacteria bacterium]
MKNIVFIAWHDVRYQIRQGGTLVWLFVMPPIFFFFIGTVTSGFQGGMTGGAATPIVVAASSPGFLQQQIDLRLRQNEFTPEWHSDVVADAEGDLPRRVLTFDANLSDKIVAGEQVKARYDTRASALSRDFEAIRIQRSLYTALADVVAAGAGSEQPLSADALTQLNAATRVWQLEVATAGERQIIPDGFEQAIPGILVMFTLLVLLTSSSSMLVIERLQGLLRRLASAPMTRTEVVSGKWGGRIILAALQIGFAVVIGTFLFNMRWGPDIGMIVVVLAAWAAFCASAGLLLGSLAKTEGQAAGLGVLLANLLAALGGCWWPIEVTPDWMQTLQNFMPTGWTMDALHKLISFQSGAASAIPNVITLLAGSLIVTALAIRNFKYE